MSGTLLQFITEPTIGPKERRLIRSHVMKGKNAGRPRQSRRKQHGTCSIVHQQDHRQQSMPPTKDQLQSDEIHMRGSEHILGPERLLWNDLALASFPLHVGSDSKKFLYQGLWATSKMLYPPEFCSEIDLSQYAWFQYGLEDKALSTSFTDRFGGHLKILPEALSHISQAYRMINERLSSPAACSDQAIAVVTILAIWQRMHHQQSHGLVHFEGLRRMIQLRGGLVRLAKENRALAQKPWRIALEFALQDGSPVSFALGDVPHSVASDPEFRNAQSIPDSGDLYRSINPNLLTHLLDVTALTTILNNTREDTRLSPLDYSDNVCLRLHGLLDFAPLGEHRRPMDPLDNLVHLSLVAIMTTLMPEYGYNQARYNLLADHLRRALHSYAVMAESARPKYNYELFLWALFVGYATVLDDDDHAWPTPMVRDICVRLNLHAWADVRQILCQYGWICVVYDKSGMKLWSKLDTRSEAGVHEARYG